MLNIGIDLALRVAEISRQAGEEIMAIYATDFTVRTKSDKTPVTQADQIAEDIILEAILNKISDTFPVISEESASNGELPMVDENPFWLIDPLDGTKEFIDRNITLPPQYPAFQLDKSYFNDNNYADYNSDEKDNSLLIMGEKKSLRYALWNSIDMASIKFNLSYTKNSSFLDNSIVFLKPSNVGIT